MVDETKLYQGGFAPFSLILACLFLEFLAYGTFKFMIEKCLSPLY